jgi:hypothetical protein
MSSLQAGLLGEGDQDSNKSGKKIEVPYMLKIP